MIVHNEPHWHHSHKWWVTWNNHSSHGTQLIACAQLSLSVDFREWLEAAKINFVVDNNKQGRAGYGFKTREDALLFYLRWQDDALGVFY
jgi:hypothetical protein